MTANPSQLIPLVFLAKLSPPIPPLDFVMAISIKISSYSLSDIYDALRQIFRQKYPDSNILHQGSPEYYSMIVLEEDKNLIVLEKRDSTSRLHMGFAPRTKDEGICPKEEYYSEAKFGPNSTKFIDSRPNQELYFQGLQLLCQTLLDWKVTP